MNDENLAVVKEFLKNTEGPMEFEVYVNNDLILKGIGSNMEYFGIYELFLKAGSVFQDVDKEIKLEPAKYIISYKIKENGN